MSICDNKLKAVIDLMKMEKVMLGKVPAYYKVVTYNPNSPVMDYGRGVLVVRLGLSQEGNFWKVTLHIGNIDDGGWLAIEGTSGSLEDKLTKMDSIAESILKDMVTVPSGDELNEALRIFGLYGFVY